MSTSNTHKWTNTVKFLFSIKGLFVVIAVYYISSRNISFQPQLEDDFGMPKQEVVVNSAVSIPVPVEMSYTADVQTKSTAVQQAFDEIQTAQKSVHKSTPSSKSKSSKISSNLANTYSNLTYTDPKLSSTPTASAPRSTSDAVAAKRAKQRAYVKRFSESAIKEMHKYGIPASITLAQGLIESNCGESRLATNNNNHFGIKCFSRSCKKGHCTNFTDDTHKDFFRKYKSTWESYRAHSVLLQKPRYKSLYKLSKTDYKGWARGLKKAGYATDPLYADKLINLIEALNLQQYDRK